MLYVSVIRLQYNKKISVSLEPIPEKNTVKIVHLWGGGSKVKITYISTICFDILNYKDKHVPPYKER